MRKHLRFLAIMLLLTVCGGVWAQDESIDFSTKGYTNAEKISSTAGNDCTVTFTNGSTSTAYYDTGKAIRIYGGGSFTVASITKTNYFQVGTDILWCICPWL